MYFGRTVPGFPAHPHRGFETITILRQGVVYHSDSLGASARSRTGEKEIRVEHRSMSRRPLAPSTGVQRFLPVTKDCTCNGK